jgi:CDP-glucose 4,6-dehydratase
VLVTGHTGFKGSWLTFWLSELGAQVCGFALEPATEPSLFSALDLSERCQHEVGDVRDGARLAATLEGFAPEVVFHLAAQPIVLEGYRDPVGTLATNVMGTANLLEALRGQDAARVCVVVTSDKCYENREWVWGYREVDPLGGRDVYSASKACQEIVSQAYRASFFGPATMGDVPRLSIATGRAGNVIGGGDWGRNRLVPDLIRAFAQGRPAEVRNPESVRPWQHVIEPLRGYLLLAQSCDERGDLHARAYNFGPAESDSGTVRTLADRLCASWGDGATWEDQSDKKAPHEAALLRLDTSLARARLGWRPRFTLDTCLDATVAWYRTFYGGASVQTLRELTAEQLEKFGAVE